MSQYSAVLFVFAVRAAVTTSASLEDDPLWFNSLTNRELSSRSGHTFKSCFDILYSSISIQCYNKEVFGQNTHSASRNQGSQDVLLPDTSYQYPKNKHPREQPEVNNAAAERNVDIPTAISWVGSFQHSLHEFQQMPVTQHILPEALALRAAPGYLRGLLPVCVSLWSVTGQSSKFNLT